MAAPLSPEEALIAHVKDVTDDKVVMDFVRSTRCFAFAGRFDARSPAFSLPNVADARRARTTATTPCRCEQWNRLESSTSPHSTTIRWQLTSSGRTRASPKGELGAASSTPVQQKAHRHAFGIAPLICLLAYSRKDLDHWFRAENPSDPSNAAIVAAFKKLGPVNISRSPAPGLLNDPATVQAQSAAAAAESEKRMALARGGGFGPAGGEVESDHHEDVPGWAKLVVGSDVAGGADGGLPVWAQDIKDALPPSVLEKVTEGVKGKDSKMVKDALASLTPAEKERLGETVKGIPAVGNVSCFHRAWTLRMTCRTSKLFSKRLSHPPFTTTR
ncbi:hypothetical protein DFJ74DRAFT_692134 [Hyaloraphidium curvatum]|nr:hypothetical protein DFJ74DRAFT_692134 [Hyaloraphidium curvatum]